MPHLKGEKNMAGHCERNYIKVELKVDLLDVHCFKILQQ